MKKKGFKFNLMKAFILSGIIFPLTWIYSETLIINNNTGSLSLSIDVPPDWQKTSVEKNNDIIVTLRHGDSEIEIRNFTSSDMSLDYIINAQAARLYGENTYVSLLLEKSEDQENLHKRTLFWKLKSYSKIRYEKTLIIFSDKNTVILSCNSSASEFQSNRVIFENALLSLSLENQKTEMIEKKKTDENLQDKTEKQSDTSSELIMEIEDNRENKANKLEKLKQHDE